MVFQPGDFLGWFGADLPRFSPATLSLTRLAWWCFENVDGLEDQIGASSQSNLDILLQTMKGAWVQGSACEDRCTSNSACRPGGVGFMSCLFERSTPSFTQVNGLWLGLSTCFNSMVASCLRSPPCAKKLLLNCSDQAVWDFFVRKGPGSFERVRNPKNLPAAGQSNTWSLLRLRDCDGGQPYPKDLKTNGWFESLTARETRLGDSFKGTSARMPASETCLSPSEGSTRWVSARRLTSTLPQQCSRAQILWMDMLHPPRVMLGREALLFQGFPALLAFLDAVATNGIDVHAQPATNVNSRKRQSQSQSKKWLTENLMTDLAGNAMALPVLLAITQSAVASLLFKAALQHSNCTGNQLLPSLPWRPCRPWGARAGSAQVLSGGLAQVCFICLWRSQRLDRSTVLTFRKWQVALEEKVWTPRLLFVLLPVQLSRAVAPVFSLQNVFSWSRMLYFHTVASYSYSYSCT